MSEPEGGSWQQRQDYWRNESQWARSSSSLKDNKPVGCGTSIFLFILFVLSFLLF